MANTLLLFLVFIPMILSPSPTKQADCPGLDSALYEIYQLDDPTERAEQLGFRVIDGKVLVVLTLADALTPIPTGYDLVIGTRIGDQAQVLSPFPVLCDLANTPEVVVIRQPVGPVLIKESPTK